MKTTERSCCRPFTDHLPRPVNAFSSSRRCFSRCGDAARREFAPTSCPGRLVVLHHLSDSVVTFEATQGACCLRGNLTTATARPEPR